MRLGKGSVLALIFAVLGMPAIAQTQPSRAPPGGAQSETPAPTLLATAHLEGVANLPYFFRLYRARLPAAQHASYRGSGAMLYDLRGAAAIEIEGDGVQPLAEGAGVFVAAGQAVTIRAPASEPADLLLFVLSARPNQPPPLDRPAVTKELFRTGEALPGLHAGAYEFTLTRLTLPAGMSADAPHYRTGAALNYILAGTGSLIADGKTEPMPAGTAQASLSGWFHQWANPGDTPLVIVRAEITQEGAPAVVPEPAK
jgi:mannose-6-phosphate isomerase-like protein (cupin superfamily)